MPRSVAVVGHAGQAREPHGSQGGGASLAEALGGLSLGYRVPFPGKRKPGVAVGGREEEGDRF